jgi:hypothetical protein
MPHDLKTFRVFIASPNDLAEERDAVREIVDEINMVAGRVLNARFEIVRWETHVRPGFGVDPQDVINEQIGDDYDVFVGMMWGRFGIPTARAESGTEEEFNRALRRWREMPASVEIMFYFKDAALQPSKIDPLQFAKVMAFKNRISSENGGLYFQFDSAEDFKGKLRVHLSTLMQKMVVSLAPVALEKPPTIPFAVLEHFSSLTDEDYDEGIIDLSEKSEIATEAMIEVLQRVTNVTDKVNKKIKARTSTAQSLVSNNAVVSRDDAKHVSNGAAEDIEEFVLEMSVIVPEYQRRQALALELMSKVIVISSSDFKNSQQDVERALNGLRGLKQSMEDNAVIYRKLRETVSGLPRMTTAFNRAKRRAVAIFDDLLAQISAGAENVDGVLSVVEKNQAMHLTQIIP